MSEDDKKSENKKNKEMPPRESADKDENEYLVDISTFGSMNVMTTAQVVSILISGNAYGAAPKNCGPCY